MARTGMRKAVWSMGVLLALGGAGYAARAPLAEMVASATNAATEDANPLAARPAQPVRVTRVAFDTVSTTESFTGTVRPQHEATLGFRLPGKIVDRLVEVGDRVAAGQVVARLDDTDARLELEAAEADLAAARIDLSRALADVGRARTLFAQGHIAQAALDRANSGAAEAQSRADRAERTRSLAANRLTYTELVAATPGIVTATPAEAGQVVAAGQQVVTLAQTGALDVIFALPEHQRDLLEQATASAELWGAEGRSYGLTLRDISPDVDPAGRTYRVRMTMTDPDAAATLGRTVTVLFTTPAEQPEVTLPLAAVLNDGQGAAVWRLAAGETRVERVPVELAAMDGKVARVRGGLAEGDLVVSLGAHKLDPDRPVRVVETAPAREM